MSQETNVLSSKCIELKRNVMKVKKRFIPIKTLTYNVDIHTTHKKSKLDS